MQAAAQRIQRSERPSITIRQPIAQFASCSSRFWFDNNPTATHFMNALSCSFPGGERFFVRSVNAYRDEVQDEQLKRDIRLFSAQEAIHGKAHEAFNRWLDSQGLPATQCENLLEWYLELHEPFFHKSYRLAYTAGLEHLTAVLGRAILGTPGFVDHMTDEVRLLWTWHALEEIEHKSVAFDVQNIAKVGYFTRTVALYIALIGLILTTSAAWLLFLIKDRQLFDFRSHQKFFQTFIASGFFAAILRGTLEYFRKDFHPWQIDDRALITHAEAWLAQHVNSNHPPLTTDNVAHW